MKFSTLSLLAFANTAVSLAVGSTTKTSGVSGSATIRDTGIPTPQPIQEGMVDNCNLFYFVKSGDTCQGIAGLFGINLLTLRTWNPAIGTDCRSLIAETYVCTGIQGRDPAKKDACSSDPAAAPWGNEKPAALEAAATWCNDKTGAPGKYTKDEKRPICINSPSGQNKFLFRVINEWGYPHGIGAVACQDVVQRAINVCDRGGSGRTGGWEAIASISAGQC